MIRNLTHSLIRLAEIYIHWKTWWWPLPYRSPLFLHWKQKVCKEKGPNAKPPLFLLKQQQISKEKGPHAQRFLPETYMWQNKQGMFNVERWGEYNCKRWVCLGNPQGGGAWHGRGLAIAGHGAYGHGHMTSTHNHEGHLDMDILAYGCIVAWGWVGLGY